MSIFKNYNKGILKILRARIDLLNEQISHQLTKGEENEQVVRDFITSYLPRKYSVSSGLLIDSYGAQSSQCDIIIYDEQNHSNILFNEKTKIFPADLTYCTIEVKTTYSEKYLEEGIDNIVKTRRNINPVDKKFSYWKFNEKNGNTELAPCTPSLPISILFFLSHGGVKDPKIIKQHIEKQFKKVLEDNNNDWGVLPDMIFSLQHGIATRFKNISTHKEENLEYMLFAKQLQDKEGNIVQGSDGNPKSIEPISGYKKCKYFVDFKNNGIYDPDSNIINTPGKKIVLFTKKGKDNIPIELSEPEFYKWVKFGESSRVIDEARSFVAFLGSIEYLLDSKKIPSYPLFPYYLGVDSSKGELF